MTGNKTLLKAGFVAALGDSAKVIESGAVVVKGSTIVEVGEAWALEKNHPDAAVVDFGGKLLMPGLINAHTHLYSALARGMPFRLEPPSNFVEILEHDHGWTRQFGEGVDLVTNA